MSSTTTNQISRLTTISHVLYDREVLALRQENEALRHDLLWKEHTLHKLREAFAIYARSPRPGELTPELKSIRNLLAYFEQTLST